MSWNDIIPAELLDKSWKDEIDKESRKNLSNQLPGKTLKFVEDYLVKNNIDYRIIRDGMKSYMIVNNAKLTRANLEIDNGIVTNVTWR